MPSFAVLTQVPLSLQFITRLPKKVWDVATKKWDHNEFTAWELDVKKHLGLSMQSDRVVGLARFRQASEILVSPFLISFDLLSSTAVYRDTAQWTKSAKNNTGIL